VADGPKDAYLSVEGSTEAEEIASLYEKMELAASAWENDFDLEFLVRRQLSAFLPVISGSRMLKDYLNFLFKPKEN
ncbi:hypothetical protein IJG21_01655, partial [Candidatus Saccharibacteria bacterium]|nr:hypothetical protein [Candidatus Saccharibacteria bacterium]